MRIRYTITKKCCPVCHTVLETDNSEFLAIVFTPFILVFFVFAIPYFIARWILFELVLCVDIPKICINPIIECPNCGAKVRINNNPTYNELNKEDKLLYDNRVLLRAAYLFGGTLLYGVLFSFFLTANDELSKIFGWIGFSLAFLCLFIVIAIVYYWKTHKADNYNKNNGQSKSDNNQKNAHGLSPNLNFEINKEKSSSSSNNTQPAKKSEQDKQTIINNCNNSITSQLHSIFTDKYFIELESAVLFGNFEKADNLIDFPFDLLQNALALCKTANEIIKTKLDFFMCLVDYDSQIKNNDRKHYGFLAFLDFGSSKITVIFSNIITYISKNITLKWQPDEDDKDGELIASGGAKESFTVLYDKLNEKGAFFYNSFKANLITDIWYEFLNNSIS